MEKIFVGLSMFSFPFTSSKSELNFYYRKENVQIASLYLFTYYLLQLTEITKYSCNVKKGNGIKRDTPLVNIPDAPDSLLPYRSHC